MSMAELVMLDLADGQERILPCGVRTLFVAVKDVEGNEEASYDLIYSDGTGCYGIKVPFSYDYPQPVRSPRANQLKIVAHGSIHLIYST